MDEEKQQQPSQPYDRDIRHILLKLLLPLDIILVVITLLTSLFIILEVILSSHGIILNFSNYGHSMDPTIKGNALCAFDTRFPFDALEIGDVIMYKEPKGLNTDTDKIRVHISKVPADGSTADPSEPATNTVEETADIEYLPDHAVLHRIVDIKDTGERALITQGDHNPYLDRYPISAEAYMGKMLWHVDYIGSVLLFLYQNFTLFLVVTILLTLSTALLRRSLLRQNGE